MLGIGLVPEGVGLGREVQFAVRVAQRHAPVARQAIAAFAVGGQQLAGPARGGDDVVRPRGERHAVGVADLQCEDGAGAITLRAREKTEAAVRRAVLDGLLELVVDHQPVEVLARNDVHHPGHRFRSIQGRCAVENVVDPLDGDVGVHVGQVGPGAARIRPIAVDVGGDAVAVHQRHGGAGADTAQVGVGFAALRSVRTVDALVPAFAGALVVGAADLGGIGIGVHADLVGLVEDHVPEVRRAGHLQVEFADDVHRRWQVEVVAPDVGSGDDHLFDVAAFFFLFFGVFVFSVVCIGGAQAQATAGE